MAGITWYSQKHGRYSDATTWDSSPNGGGSVAVPGDDDTVVIRHVIYWDVDQRNFPNGLRGLRFSRYEPQTVRIVVPSWGDGVTYWLKLSKAADMSNAPPAGYIAGDCWYRRRFGIELMGSNACLPPGTIVRLNGQGRPSLSQQHIPIIGRELVAPALSFDKSTQRFIYTNHGLTNGTPVGTDGWYGQHVLFVCNATQDTFQVSWYLGGPPISGSDPPSPMRIFTGHPGGRQLILLYEPTEWGDGIGAGDNVLIAWPPRRLATINNAPNLIPEDNSLRTKISAIGSDYIFVEDDPGPLLPWAQVTLLTRSATLLIHDDGTAVRPTGHYMTTLANGSPGLSSPFGIVYFSFNVEIACLKEHTRPSQFVGFVAQPTLAQQEAYAPNSSGVLWGFAVGADMAAPWTTLPNIHLLAPYSIFSGIIAACGVGIKNATRNVAFNGVVTGCPVGIASSAGDAPAIINCGVGYADEGKNAPPVDTPLISGCTIGISHATYSSADYGTVSGLRIINSHVAIWAGNWHVTSRANLMLASCEYGFAYVSPLVVEAITQIDVRVPYYACNQQPSAGDLYPATGDVRAGVVYGPVGSLVGTLTLPDPAYVIVGTSYGADGTEFTGRLLAPENGGQGSFTSLDRAMLTAIYSKLPSRPYLTGTTNATGAGVDYPTPAAIAGAVLDEPKGNHTGWLTTLATGGTTMSITQADRDALVQAVTTAVFNEPKGSHTGWLTQLFPANGQANLTATSVTSVATAVLQHTIDNIQPDDVEASLRFLILALTRSTTQTAPGFLSVYDVTGTTEIGRLPLSFGQNGEVVGIGV